MRRAVKLKVVKIVKAYVEPAAATLPAEANIQFERLGYFVTDRFDHTANKPVINRTVTLRDVWAKGV